MRKISLVLSGLIALFAVQEVLAEGSYQVGLNQPLYDYGNGQILYVDVVTVGEVINVSLCGSSDSDTMRVRILDPGSTQVVDTSFVSNVSCSDSFSSPLTTPYRYTTTQTGTYTLWLDSNSGQNLNRFDVTVTANSATDPDPTEQGGRLWADRWGFNAGSYSLANSTDANYYTLVPGGRANTNYVWQLDLNNLAGYVYYIVANNLGVNDPNSGYSVPTSGNSVTPKFPIYLGYPTVADVRPDDPPVITGYRFIDSDGQDMGISPSSSISVQDSGTFEFTSDVAGNYAIVIDTDQNGVYGANDKLLLGDTVVGLNQVAWSGDDANGSTLAPGFYNARLQVRMGEYHFIANDVETSGGVGVTGAEDGLTIFLANSDGSLEDVRVYWDDETFFSIQGGLSNLPDGALASTSAGHHTWGTFSSSSLGNNAYIDTYVHGLSSFATAQSAVVLDDTPLSGADGILSSTPATLTAGDSLTIEVNDADLNIIPTVIESVVVTVTNSRSGEVEQLTLSETGVNTGVFSQVVSTQLSPQAGTNNDGNLRIWDGDLINSSYQDQLDSAGSSTQRTAQSTVQNDLDGDGLTDSSDLDDDNDGITDVDEGSALVDTDGDGVVDSLDLDSDNDGLFDLFESGATVTGLDGNNDGAIDSGFGSNGLADSVETTADSGSVNYTLRDTDSDSVYDFRDLDSDNDGLTDVIESGGADGDGDGIIGSGVPVVDANGIPAGGGLTMVDSDNDGIGDQRELDADGDGLSDLVEAGGSDSNSDGLVDSFTDANGDGLDDTIAGAPLTPTDTNGDGLPDYQDNTDSDGDGLVDSADLDDDNDGILDTAEGSEAVDTDGDGVADSLDLDSDNDGLFDLIESGALITGLDGDNDGRIDSGFGSNGLADALETSADSGSVNYILRDTDSDTVHDFRDLDSDNDGIPDVTEAGGSDADSDGLLGTGVPVVDSNGVPAGGGQTPPDTDSDGAPDPIDADADDDGLLDLVEGGGTDSNSDGLVDAFTDVNSDGMDDGIAASPLPIPDSNSDGTPDFQDATDSDGDGLVNTVDLDDDNDGILDTAEGSEAVDTDGDGVADSLDLDSDNDGLFDLIESGALITGLDGDNDGRIDSGFGSNGLADSLETTADSGSVNYTLRDTDSDTIYDFRDLDSDGDGVTDVVEAAGSDPDSDGIIGSGTPAVDASGVPAAGGLTPPDYNGDGIPDTLDSADGDSDGILDSLDLDLDNDGIPNTSEGDGLVDTDSDGTPDTLDLDSDGDGLLDLVEAGGTDANNDGLVDGYSDVNSDGLDDSLAASPLPLTDSNSDGTPDFQDATDSDGDGLVDSLDLDDDNDGILDSVEGDEAVDTDGDGVADSLDLDSDNDGLSDLVESGANVTGLDSDNDGRIDSSNSFGSNGLVDTLETSAESGSVNYTLRDSDSDAVADFRDLDSDGDGLYDLLEVGGLDGDANGRVDGFTDLDSDGLQDALSGALLNPPDSDSDGVVNYLDLDSDNDGLYDVVEAAGADTDGDGLLGNSPQSVDANGVASGSGLTPLDSDGDGVPNRLDLDSDNDGIPDVSESGGSDADGDGQVGSGTPVVDIHGVTGGPVNPSDADIDSVPNHLDTDADGDGLLDLVEGGGVDTNGDGLVDGFTDANGDGLDDLIATTPLPLPDTDGDTIPDFLDNDDQDNDGIPDSIDLDLDNDGIPNNLEGDGLVDTDNDGVADSFDLDSDNDGLFDLYESGADSVLMDTNDDGRIDSTWSVGVNGLANNVETTVDSGLIAYNGGVLLDTDGDGIADFRDLDSDNDGLYDVTEAAGNDPDNDGVLGSVTPSVNTDGLAAGSGLTPVDSDGDGVDDQRDLDSDNDGVTDVIENGGSDPDGDGQPGSGTLPIDPTTGVPLIGGGLMPVDHDGDGTPNYLDLDSDNDGVFDLAEAGLSVSDSSPEDGVIDSQTDSNGNGLDDSLEGVALNLPDSDGDGTSDMFDSTNDLSGGEQPVKTGLNGVGGCSIARGAAFDPLLPTLLIMALAYLGLGRRKLSGQKERSRSMKQLIVVSLTIGVLAMPWKPLNAASADGWYAGLGFGLSRLKPDRNGSIYSVDDKSSKAFKLTLGYDWSESIAIEGYYADLGEAGMSPSGNIGYRDLGVAGLYYLYGEKARMQQQGLDIFAKAGMGWMKNDTDLPYERMHNSHVMLGLGAGYNFGKGLALRADLDLYDKDSQSLTLNLIKRFGGESEPQPAVAMADTPVVMALDSDGDGVEDPADNCADTPVGTPVDASGCVLVLDGDGDSVPDVDDQCPQTPAGLAVNASGCVSRIELEGITFEHDKGRLTEASKAILDQVAQQLKQRPDVKAILVIGHTDDKGPAAYNQKLSEKRARVVVSYLVSKGIDSGKLTAIGKGETQPIADNASESGREQNRRVELELQSY